MEIPANLRLKYFRATQTHLPDGEEGIIEFKRVFEAYTVLTRKVLFEKYKPNPHLVTSIGGVVRAYVIESNIDDWSDEYAIQLIQNAERKKEFPDFTSNY